MATERSKTLCAPLPILGCLNITAASYGLIQLKLEPTDDLQKLMPFMAAPTALPPVTFQDTVHWQFAKQIEEYLQGTRRQFDIPIGVLICGVQKRVLDIVKTVEYGKTATYQEIATKLGDVKATQAVQNALMNNPVPIVIACHRAIKNCDDTGGYVWGRQTKQRLLQLESRSRSFSGGKDHEAK